MQFNSHTFLCIALPVGCIVLLSNDSTRCCTNHHPQRNLRSLRFGVTKCPPSSYMKRKACTRLSPVAVAKKKQPVQRDHTLLASYSTHRAIIQSDTDTMLGDGVQNLLCENSHEAPGNYGQRSFPCEIQQSVPDSQRLLARFVGLLVTSRVSF